MKRKFNIVKFLEVICILLAIITVIVICVFKFIFKNNKDNNSVVGSWTTDNVTVYKFNEDNSGELILPLSKYKFTYKIKDNKLMIDFENEKSEDSTYTYSFEDNKLILKGTNGTFKFKKKK